MKTSITETDNRDPTCTTLSLKHTSLQVDVNPVELFKNALENAGVSHFTFDGLKITFWSPDLEEICVIDLKELS
jgi:hypothetical protein